MFGMVGGYGVWGGG